MTPREVQNKIHALTLTLQRTREEAHKSLMDVSEEKRRAWNISRWERGVVVPTLDRFITWADALGFDVTLTPKEEK
jgi:transcriptional regulator with XRE-family HTH domain